MFLVFSLPSQQVTGWGIIYLMILFFECQSVELSVPLKCRSKCLIQLWTWNLDCWGSAPKKAQKHLMGEFERTTSQVRSWNPAWLLRAWSRHLGSGETPWRVLCTAAPTFLTLGSSSLGHEAQLWGVRSGPSPEVWVQVLLPKTIFCKREKRSWGTLLFLLLPRWSSQGGGGMSLPPWAVPQRATRSEVFCCPQPFLAAESTRWDSNSAHLVSSLSLSHYWWIVCSTELHNERRPPPMHRGHIVHLELAKATH